MSFYAEFLNAEFWPCLSQNIWKRVSFLSLQPQICLYLNNTLISWCNFLFSYGIANTRPHFQLPSHICSKGHKENLFLSLPLACKTCRVFRKDEWNQGAFLTFCLSLFVPWIFPVKTYFLLKHLDTYGTILLVMWPFSNQPLTSPLLNITLLLSTSPQGGRKLMELCWWLVAMPDNWVGFFRNENYAFENVVGGWCFFICFFICVVLLLVWFSLWRYGDNPTICGMCSGLLRC